MKPSNRLKAFWQSTRAGEQRSCGTCTLCCKVVGVQALAKPKNKWCQHCVPGKGCSIYGEHPNECRDFSCTWLQNELPDDWFPTKSKMVMRDDNGGFVCEVDIGFPQNWRKAPYYGDLMELAAHGLSRPAGQQFFVNIFVGMHCYGMTPEGPVDIGVVGVGETIKWTTETTR